MRKGILFTAAVLLATSALSARGGYFAHHSRWYNQNYNSGSTSVAELTQQQKDDLTFMYQEEKLARDVYNTLGDIWNARVFKNIQRSEQRHMNSVKYLLNKYNLPTPVLSDDIGVFEDEELQALYNELVEKGKLSLKDALEVGVAIEEKDIADLEAKIVNVPKDIERVFKNLDRGSYNHLRAFNRNLGAL
jgi:hypothetical protein